MEKVKLKLGDLLQLESEINGLVIPEKDTQRVIYEGFTKQNLSIILKYELKELGEFLKTERKKIEELRDELIKKYGEDDNNGGIFVKMWIEETDKDGNVTSKYINPKYVEFDNEYGTLLDQEKEIDTPEITIEDLKRAGDTKDDYKVLFTLIKKGTL